MEAILKYAEAFGFSDDLAFFFKVITGMDAEFMQFEYAKRQAEAKASRETPKAPKRR